MNMPLKGLFIATMNHPLVHLRDELLEEIIMPAYEDDAPDVSGPLRSETAWALSRVCRRLAEVLAIAGALATRVQRTGRV